MAITNGYATLAELRARLGNYDAGDTDDDSMLENVIEAVSRWIDDYTWRRFYVTSETRYYSAENSQVIDVHDIYSASGSSIDTLKTDTDGDRAYEYTWASTDYDLLPLNAALDGVPYTHIEVTPNGDHTFPTTVTKGVEIKAYFGYSATVPDPINEACLLQSERVFKRKDAPFGIAGGSDLGGIVRIEERLDPDVKQLLDPYRRMV